MEWYTIGYESENCSGTVRFRAASWEQAEEMFREWWGESGDPLPTYFRVPG